MKLTVLDADGQTLGELHAQHVLETCADDLGCRQPCPARHKTVDGVGALSQSRTSPDSAVTSWAVTLATADTVVRFDGASTDLQDALDGGVLKDPLATLRVCR